MADRIQHRRDTAERWASINPVLLEGEIGYVLDNPNQYKIGDGIHVWNDLPLRGFTGNISQELGNDENAVISQKVVTEKFSKLDIEVASLSSHTNEKLYLEFGGLDISGNNQLSNLRVRTSHYVYAPSTIMTNNGYKILYVCLYTIDASGNIVFAREESVNSNIWNVYDKSFIYRVVFSKTSDEAFSDSEFSKIILEYKYNDEGNASIIKDVNTNSSHISSCDIDVLVEADKISRINSKIFPIKAQSGDKLTIRFNRSGVLSDITGFYLVYDDGTIEAVYSPSSMVNITASKDVVGVKFYLLAETVLSRGTINISITNNIHIRSLAEEMENLGDINEKVNKLYQEKNLVVDVYKDQYLSRSWKYEAIAGDVITMDVIDNSIYSDILTYVKYVGDSEHTQIDFLGKEITLTKPIQYVDIYTPTGASDAGVLKLRVRCLTSYADYLLNIKTGINGNFVKLDFTDKATFSNGPFIEYEDGYSTNSANCGRWKIKTDPSFKKIHTTLGFNALTDLAIGFYKDTIISKENYIKEASIASKYGICTYDIDIPSEARMAVVLNRNNTFPNSDVRIEVSVGINDFITSEISASDYSAHLVVPSWYKENNYLDNKVKRINNLIKDCAGHGDAFIFISDEHVDYLVKNFRSPSLIKYIMDKCPISKVFHGGDCCNGQDDLIQFFVNCMRAASPFGFYSTIGNHEYMNSQTDSSLYSCFSWFNNNQIGSVNDRNYYYVDNVQQKIRYVVLNAFAQSEKANNQDSNSDGVLSEGASDGYENEQLVWLQNEALNVDSTWTIIIVTHVLANIVMANDAIYYDANAAKAYQVLNEHNQKSDKGKIAFVIHGHTHRDRLVLSNGKIPIVITTCDACIAYDNDINVDRSAGTINEQAFDVVVVDKKKKNAIAVRIGAPALDGVNEVPGSAVEERIVTWS